LTQRLEWFFTLLVKLARKNKAKVLMAWAARLDKGKGYELNVKPVNILSSTGRVELIY
jgi:KDO2-lipid IV(A) lauroyltransferase